MLTQSNELDGQSPLNGGERFYQMLISEAYDLYRKSEIIAGGLSNKTFESYFYGEKLAVKYFSDVDITSLTPADVRGFYDHLLSWQKPDTARCNIVCLRAVIKLCWRNGLPVINPDLIKVPKREKRVIQYLTEPEIDAFIEVVGQRRKGYAEINRLRNIAIVELLSATGLRVSELCRLNRDSIKERQFTVVGKSKSPRICFITKRAEQALESYLSARNDNNRALFVSNETGERITTGTVRRIFQNACNRSEFNGVHPHTIRHSFATTLLSHEVDIRYISDLMGHESLDTTKMYTHFTNPKLRSIYEMAMETS